MRVKQIENISQENVQLNLGSGIKLTLEPGASFKNIRVENLDKIKNKVKVTSDLGEICEDHSGSVRLYD